MEQTIDLTADDADETAAADQLLESVLMAQAQLAQATHLMASRGPTPRHSARATAEAARAAEATAAALAAARAHELAAAADREAKLRREVAFTQTSYARPQT